MEELLKDGCVSVAGAAKFMGISRSRLYQHLQAGRLAFCKDGKRTLIPRRALVRFLAERIHQGWQP